jgi:hypothetical protein
MERRKFISKGIAAGAILPATYAALVGTEAYEWAEAYHYIGDPVSILSDYIEKNAITK